VRSSSPPSKRWQLFAYVSAECCKPHLWRRSAESRRRRRKSGVWKGDLPGKQKQPGLNQAAACDVVARAINRPRQRTPAQHLECRRCFLHHHHRWHHRRRCHCSLQPPLSHNPPPHPHRHLLQQAWSPTDDGCAGRQLPRHPLRHAVASEANHPPFQHDHRPQILHVQGHGLPSLQTHRFRCLPQTAPEIESVLLVALWQPARSLPQRTPPWSTGKSGSGQVYTA
jgi:hypothetical protein